MDRYSAKMRIDARGRRHFSGVMVESEDGDWCRYDDVLEQEQRIAAAPTAEELVAIALHFYRSLTT